jgi:nitrogen fixation protein NifU and related proteins
MFTAQIKDHFEHPRNSGEVSNPDASVLLDNPVCGDVLQLTLRISHDRIEEIRFRAQGCVPLIACASVLTELAKGQTLSTARALNYTQINEALGGLPSASTHAGHLAIKALAAALDQIDPKKTLETHLSAHT